MENKQVAVYIRVGNASQLQERAELYKNALEKYALNKTFVNEFTQEW